MKDYYVYIITNVRNSVVYTGMTNDLNRRMSEHKSGAVEGFSKRYRLKKLVYFEMTTNVWDAIAREKEIKGWTRDKKIALIESMNPNWEDLTLSF
ncbi:MAG: GIY-YIG nuclease family protein [Eggerthellaceae bacterium]|nr:GIY-YIG nuclease family protein [Eggerthellaceae bacterium]